MAKVSSAGFSATGEPLVSINLGKGIPKTIVPKAYYDEVRAESPNSQLATIAHRLRKNGVYRNIYGNQTNDQALQSSREYIAAQRASEFRPGAAFTGAVAGIVGGGFASAAAGAAGLSGISQLAAKSIGSGLAKTALAGGSALKNSALSAAGSGASSVAPNPLSALSEGAKKVLSL
jgi:hypothetical protein